ncbi:hypothetical protein M426DRAFT_325880 [Hypoxylon sp. CI-4A]|nr:hypothetical protein M426DRAFT_325880 [Hypoxylon sp. CI-4A]
MAKNKKGGSGPRFKGQRFQRGKGPPTDYNAYGSSSTTSRSFVRAHGLLSLADEARNTAHNRRGAFGKDAGLRYKPVTFISAGLMNPLEDLDKQLTTEAKAPPTSTLIEESTVLDIVPVIDAHSPTDNVSISSPRGKSPQSQRSVLNSSAEDIPRHEETPKTGYSPDPNSDSGSDSAEEVILFRGRDPSRRKPTPTIPSRDDTDIDSLKLHELDLKPKVTKRNVNQDAANQVTKTKTEEFISLSSKPKGRGRQRRRKQKNIDQASASDDEAAIIADYMANIKDSMEDEETEEIGQPNIGTHGFSILRDLGGTDSDAIPDDVSSKDGTDSGSEDEFNIEDQHRLEADDEHLARMLAKQEELGLGGDDILLFDGEGMDDDWMGTSRADPRRKRKGDSKTAKIIQKQGQYPSATKMADTFDELDLMDWHRPSLGNYKKGPPAFGVSDSELEEAMKSTWQKDRLKKAEKKKAREELRSQGLLGKNVNPDDLRVKYLGGMSLDDLANELESFLLSSQEQLILPPFDKNTRKTIHALANRLKIKSQSAGKGQNRCPVLYRVKATLPFDQVTFDEMFGRIKQTWFPRVDADEKLVNNSRLLKRAEARNGKTRFKNSLTYRDGDIVGQHAAELGVENKGRAMLEKMGWSKGMALGTGENKGIMVPITHVVKKTKAGLGDA